MIERLRQALGGMGYDLGAAELLDVLWLARVLNDAAATAATADGTAPGTAATGPGQPSDDALEPRPSGSGERTGADPLSGTPAPSGAPDGTGDAPAAERRHSLFAAHTAPAGAAGAPARAVRSPGPRALPGLHALARSLRPLRGHRDHRHRTVADIEATVRLTAESGLFDIVDRPEQELRHSAVLLVDASASLRVWQPLVRDVRRLLERGGVFRAVHVHRFDPRGASRAGSVARSESPVVLVLTDGVDGAWQGRAARRFLGAWERSGPLVVLPPLPRRLWRGTAFDAVPQLLVAERRFAPNSALGVIDPLGGGPVEQGTGRLPVPVVPLSPAGLSAWARLLTRPGVPQLLDTVLLDGHGEPGAPGTGALSVAVPEPSAEERLDRFRASFSPDAYRLAVRLSAIRPLSLPVIQLLRIATLPAAAPAVVAEVFLGGVLQPLPDGAPAAGLPSAVAGGPGEPLYDFAPGVRDLLASGLGTEQSIEVVEAVGRALEPYMGRLPDFAALLADPGGSARLSSAASAFAVLIGPALDRLYGGSRTAVPGGAEAPGTVAGPGRRPPSGSLRFTVFGPHLARLGDEPLAVGPPERRAVLAALLLHGRRSVSVLELPDAVWGEDAPESAPRTVSAHVSALSRVLAPFGCVVEEQPDGYRLRAGAGGAAVPLDLDTAERLHAEAKSAYASGDPAAARRLLIEACAPLDGTPLEGVPGPYAEAQRARLDEWRLLLVESRVDLDLALGEYGALLPRLGRLVSVHPLRERMRAQLMVALYRTGQVAEALAAYADVRRLLAEELGIEPGRELRSVQRSILQGLPADALRTGYHPALAPPVAPDEPSWPPAEGVCFAVLGPVRTWRSGVAQPSGSPQQRALLAALLLRQGRTATASELIDAVWGDDPPSQALAATRTYAARLRKALGSGVLVREAGGYALRFAPGSLDLNVAGDLAAEAERARTADDLPRARELLVRSLALWDSEPLASVPGPYAENQRARLHEWRLQLLETRIDLDLEQGAHAEAVPELTALTAAHPLRERLRELLMLALYRSGRQAEALAVYADTRRLLADELGVDPRPELFQLQQRILRGDGDLLLPPVGGSAGRPPSDTPRPAMLPAAIADFTGDARFLRQLSERLAGTGSGDAPAPPVLVLAGIGGVGKTCLAVQVAHETRGYFPDGQLYADLQGAGARATPPEEALGVFLRALGTPDSAIPDSLDERAALYRAVLDGRRVLVLLDNARDAAQVRPLLPGTAGCATLVTSRTRMAELAGAHLVDLDAMSPEAALRLFTRIVGEERVAEEREAALDVVAACGFLPLALRIAASRLAARRAWTISALAAGLADERRRLDELQMGDLAVKATFELGYGQLEPARARAFRLLSLADGPDISLAAAAALLALPEEGARELLESLVDTSLLESSEPGRYRYHDLVRLYARSCAERDERPPGEGESALSRLLDFYLATAVRVYAIERPGDRLIDHLERSAHPGLVLDGSDDALDWLYREAPCLLACAGQSSGPIRLRRAVDLLWAVQDLSESGAYSGLYTHTAHALLTAAQRAGDEHAEGRAALTVSRAGTVLGRFAEAEELAEHALRQASVSRDRAAVCRAEVLVGTIALQQGRLHEAERHCARAVDAFRADGDRTGEAAALVGLARVRLARGLVPGAVMLGRQAVAVHDEVGLPLRGANARYALGIALTQAGRHDEARTVLQQAQEVFRDHRRPLWEGMAFSRLAELELAAEHPRRAAAHAEQALAQLSRSGGDWRRGAVLVTLGRALHAMEQTDRARVCWQEALTLFEGHDTAETGKAEEVRGLLGSTAALSSASPLPGTSSLPGGNGEARGTG